MPMQTTGPTYNTGFNPYTQMYPTYPQFQPMQTYNQPNQSVNRTIFGRVINSENDITPNEVPMDGSISLFPLADYSKIFAKQWSQDGTIKTTVFSMDPSTDNANQGYQLQQCCCDIKQSIADNTRAITDQLNQFRMEDKNDTIAELRSQVQALNLA